MLSLSVLNILLSITAILGNILIQVALHKESSVYPPTKLLLRVLSASDLCVGLIAGLFFGCCCFFFTLSLSSLKVLWNICRYTINCAFISSYFLGPMSLLILTAISVVRLLSLLLGLRYRHVITLRRTWVTVITICALSSLSSTIYFWNEQVTVWCGVISISLCLLISILSYTKIFLKPAVTNFKFKIINNNQA